MFEWLSSFNVDVIKHDDSFARTTQGKLLGIKSAIQNTLADGTQRIVLVSHFAETFTLIQDMLDKHEIDYEVPTEILNRGWFDQLKKDQCAVQTTMAQMLKPFDDQGGSESIEKKAVPSVRLTVIVTERHPLKSAEDQLEQFCNSLPCKVQWGYFLSFEDEVIRRLLDERALKILDMFGMGANELVNSKMLSRRLAISLKKLGLVSAVCEPADSAAQWFELNMK